MENNENQTYTIEEKTGKIVKVEEAKEEQKKQKKALRVKIAALCTAIGITGIGVFAFNQHEMQENNNVTMENTLSDEEMEKISHVENSLKEYHQTAEESTQKEIMNNLKEYLQDDIIARTNMLQGVYNATFNHYNGSPVVDGFDTSNTYGQIFTEAWANSSDKDIVNCYNNGKADGEKYRRNNFIANNLEEITTLNNALNILLNPTIEEEKNDIYIYKSVDSVGYKLSCNDYTLESMGGWLSCGKLEGTSFATDLLLLDKTDSIEKQYQMYRQETREKDPETNQYGAWVLTDKYIKLPKESLAPSEEENIRYRYVGNAFDVWCNKISYDDLHLYELCNVETTNSDTITTGLNEFIISNNVETVDHSTPDGLTWLDKGLLKDNVKSIIERNSMMKSYINGDLTLEQIQQQQMLSNPAVEESITSSIISADSVENAEGKVR